MRHLDLCPHVIIFCGGGGDDDITRSDDVAYVTATQMLRDGRLQELGKKVTLVSLHRRPRSPHPFPAHCFLLPHDLEALMEHVGCGGDDKLLRY